LLAREAGCADAGVAASAVLADAAVLTRIVRAVVALEFAVLPVVSNGAHTFVLIDAVRADAAVEAAIDGAIVDVELAVLAGEAGETLAGECA
jgi:hypothetical protein